MEIPATDWGIFKCLDSDVISAWWSGKLISASKQPEKLKNHSQAWPENAGVAVCDTNQHKVIYEPKKGLNSSKIEIIEPFKKWFDHKRPLEKPQTHRKDLKGFWKRLKSESKMWRIRYTRDNKNFINFENWDLEF